MASDNDASTAGRQLAKLGAKKGGRARASTLTATERSEIARKAGNARWKNAKKDEDIRTSKETDDAQSKSAKILSPYSMFRGKLSMGNVSFECHVLSDGRRVLTQGEVVKLLTGGSDTSNLSRYLRRNPLYDESQAEKRTIRFRVPGSPTIATGYEATLLIEICESYLQARDEKLLRPSQYKLARTSEAVLRACAKVGIIALVDEATGYQKIRAKRALQFKLQAFIAEEMQEWALMFPDEFWLELARLEGIHYSPRNRPLRWGKYVMVFVYDAVDGDVGKELRKINPDPHHRKNHHQWLREHGREKVNNQIQQVIAIMKLCDDMGEFKHKFARVFSRSPLQLSLDDMSDF